MYAHYEIKTDKFAKSEIVSSIQCELDNTNAHLIDLEEEMHGHMNQVNTDISGIDTKLHEHEEAILESNSEIQLLGRKIKHHFIALICVSAGLLCAGIALLAICLHILS